jgi:hypothetical protein
MSSSRHSPTWPVDSVGDGQPQWVTRIPSLNLKTSTSEPRPVWQVVSTVHGLPKVLPGPVMPDPSTLCRRAATPETAFRLLPLWIPPVRDWVIHLHYIIPLVKEAVNVW